MYNRFARFALMVLVAVFISGEAATLSANEKAGIRPGFESVQLDGEKIVLLRPEIRVGEQSTAGIYEPRAEWMDEARLLMDAELQRVQSDFRSEIVEMPDLVGDDAAMVAEYQALFRTVAQSIVEYQFFAGNRLPTQKRSDFDWTLGEGTSRLAELTGARYGLFIYTEDHYGSTGRKILQFAAAGLLGVGVSSGVHVGYAGLVDLETGHVLWLNADGQMGGDVREADGMEKRVGQLFEDFPGARDDVEGAGD